MKIDVKYVDTGLFGHDPDHDEGGKRWNEPLKMAFRCQHVNQVVEPPCCNGIDCACRGHYAVYCDDCGDMTDREKEAALESALEAAEV